MTSDRDRIANARDEVALERERKADQRDRLADERDRLAGMGDTIESVGLFGTDLGVRPVRDPETVGLFGIDLGVRPVRDTTPEPAVIAVPTRTRRPVRTLTESLAHAAAVRNGTLDR
jgi:hypothetical protein